MKWFYDHYINIHCNSLKQDFIFCQSIFDCMFSCYICEKNNVLPLTGGAVKEDGIKAKQTKKIKFIFARWPETFPKDNPKVLSINRYKVEKEAIKILFVAR